MNSHEQDQLMKELCQAGARPAEAAKLLPIASRLKLLADKQPAGVELRRAVPNRFRLLRPLTLGAAGLAVGVIIVVASQSVLPTSWLYPVQKLSDSVAVSIDPDYRATVMMKPAQQVNSLVAARSGSQKILGTLADYASQAKAYKSMPNTNYAAFEYCESNLRQAATAAPPNVRQAIETSLQLLGAS